MRYEDARAAGYIKVVSLGGLTEAEVDTANTGKLLAFTVGPIGASLKALHSFSQSTGVYTLRAPQQLSPLPGAGRPDVRRRTGGQGGGRKCLRG